MSKLIYCHAEQNSEEWFQDRLGIPTASSFKHVLAKGEGKTRRTYMLKLISEMITGQRSPGFSNVHTERGHEYEDEAATAYELIKGCDTKKTGFIKNDFCGCSPDRLVDDNGLVEIKTRLSHIYLEVLLAGKVPSPDKAQVQGQIMVTEREWCDYVCYCPGHLPFIKRAYRDDKYISDLEIAIKLFIEEMMGVKEKVLKMMELKEKILKVNP